MRDKFHAELVLSFLLGRAFLQRKGTFKAG